MNPEKPATLLDPSYVAGLIDSCGRFTVHIAKSQDSSIGYYLSPVVGISRSNSGALFQHIEQFLEAYGIEYSMRKSQPGHSTGFTIMQPDEIRKFADAAGPYLIAEHRSAVLLVEEVLPAYESGVNQSKEAFFEVMAVVEDIHEIHGKESKYSQDYFADKWSDDVEIKESSHEQ